jgi:hypothetical protein
LVDVAGRLRPSARAEALSAHNRHGGFRHGYPTELVLQTTCETAEEIMTLWPIFQKNFPSDRETSRQVTVHISVLYEKNGEICGFLHRVWDNLLKVRGQ